MEQKIELEIRLRELASQSLLEARNEIDVLEVEKSLLTSDQRMNCYAGQLEAQRRQLSSTASLSTDSGRASKTSTTTNNTTNRALHHRRDNSLGRGGRDVVRQPSGEDGAHTALTSGAGSPSFSSLSKSSQSSPSKLSPVSGESANSPPSSSDKLADEKSACLSSSSAASSCHRSRRRSDQLNSRQLMNSGAGGTNTVNRRGSANTKSKSRERLRQSITGLSNINCNMVLDNKATLTISELRIPLMWRDVDHFKGRGDYRRYAVFCLLKIGSQIYDTQLISDVDRQMTDLTFEDVIVFNNSIDHEFELTLEVYSCVYLEQFSLASTPRKLKEKLSNSVSRAMGRRLATQTASANYTKELEAYDKSYRFAMIASAQLRLPDVADSIKTYDLLLISPEAHGRRASQHRLSSEISANLNHQQLNTLAGRNHQHSAIVTSGNQKDVHKNTLPLFGHFCCKLHVRPDVFDKCVKSGYLKIASINLSELVAKHRGDSDDRRSKSRSDSPVNSSDKSSSSNDDIISATANDNSMLRSALAASSKLATVSLSTSTVHWALLRNFTLHLWHIDEQKLQVAARRGHAPQVDISGKQPFCIGIDKFTRLLRISNSSLTIETDKGCFVIAVYEPNEHTRSGNHDEIGHWLRPIEQMIYDSHIWGPVLNHYPPTHRNKNSK